MDGDLNHWLGSFPNPFGWMGDDVQSVGVEHDMHCFPLATDSASIVDRVPSMPFLPISDLSSTQDALHISHGGRSTTQRQQPLQSLYINTQLGPTDDQEASTTSSSSFIQVPQTPYIQPYPRFQPFVHTSSPQSVLAESAMLMPDFEKTSPLVTSPLSPYPPASENDMFYFPQSPLPVEPDVVTASPMPHIVEWRRVIGLFGAKDFIPQTVYQPYTEADKKRYIQDVELKETIFFCLGDSLEPGIPVDDILKQKIRHLKDKDSLMFTGCGPSVSIRIQWPGYRPWSKQIPTMDFKTPKGPITRAKLAKNIATCIRRFAASVQDKPMEAESDGKWKIGKGYVEIEDLILVSLHHVSKGSWQPQLRTRRPVVTFPRTFPPAVSAS